jgi:hypothetical protein
MNWASGPQKLSALESSKNDPDFPLQRKDSIWMNLYFIRKVASTRSYSWHRSMQGSQLPPGFSWNTAGVCCFLPRLISDQDPSTSASLVAEITGVWNHAQWPHFLLGISPVIQPSVATGSLSLGHQNPSHNTWEGSSRTKWSQSPFMICITFRSLFSPG